MLPETKSALAGLSRGIMQGAALAFLVVGIVTVAALAMNGAFVVTIPGGPIVSIFKAAGAFLLSGAMAAPVGAVAGGAYEAYNEYLEEKEVQKFIKEAKTITKNSEVYDVMHETEKMTPGFEQTIAENPPNLETTSRSGSAVSRLQQARGDASVQTRAAVL